MMVGCVEKLLAILKDEDTPFWDKAEAEHYLREHMITNAFDAWLESALKWRV